MVFATGLCVLFDGALYGLYYFDYSPDADGNGRYVTAVLHYHCSCDSFRDSVGFLPGIFFYGAA